MADPIEAELSIAFTQFNLPEPLGVMFAFTFNPTVLTLPIHPADSTYQFIVSFQSNIPDAALSGGIITKNGEKPPGHVETTPGPEPGQVTVTFTDTGITPQTQATYNYHVTVTTPGPNGQTWESDDPEIVLGPPPG